MTSYEQLRLQRAALLGVPWGYVILDEGHKIRNPDAEVTLVAKQLRTVRYKLNFYQITPMHLCLWHLKGVLLQRS